MVRNGILNGTQCYWTTFALIDSTTVLNIAIVNAVYAIAPSLMRRYMR